MIDRLVGTLTEETLEHLTALCDEMERTNLGPDVDRHFHRTLYATLDNPLVGQLVDVFWDSYHAAQTVLTLSAATDSAHTVAQHRAIVDALRSGDSHRLRTAMLEHFADIKNRLDSSARRY